MARFENEDRPRRDGPRRDGGFRREGGFRRFSSEPRQMHKAKCAKCGKDCEVPFQPKEGRPVYCSECFREQRMNAGF